MSMLIKTKLAKIHGLCCLHVHLDGEKKKERIGYSIHINEQTNRFACVIMMK